MRPATCAPFLIALAAAALAAGCDGTDAPTGSHAPASPPPRVLPAPTFGTGTVRGTVKFVGAPPPRQEIPNVPCHDGAGPLKDETVVVNANGTLANVFVSLAGVSPSDGSGREPALLDQVDCRYVPHALAVQVNQPLRVRTSDPGTLHNVHYNPTNNPPANFGLTVAGAERPVTFARPEYVRIKCDVHPWMSGYVGVFDHPFFAVTPEGDGAFQIPRVPPGSYKLLAWHERYGEVEQRVEVGENGVSEVTVRYEEN
ncbi:MAG TPA: hypothetical protein VER17_16780 [Tepidisphaeraceae bacterium]|nr:hypothetical protein [Tepidisphaeraceae bacterium]